MRNDMVVFQCIQKFMATKNYYEICKKHKFEESCYKNSHWPTSGSTTAAWEKPTADQTSGCSDGYCSCSDLPA